MNKINVSKALCMNNIATNVINNIDVSNALSVNNSNGMNNNNSVNNPEA